MSYRNKVFYGVMIRNMDEKKAFDYITRNLLMPSFEGEKQNAEAAWFEKFGYPFMSPERKKAADNEAEIERLRSELAEKKVSKPVPKPTEEVIDTVTFSKAVYKEWFIANHPETTPLVIGKAWKKYCKENGITE